MIDAPGIYANVPMAEYVADPVEVPSLSASIGWAIQTRTPLHGWAAHPRLNPYRIEKQGAAMDFGTVAHALLLGDGPKLVRIDAADYRKKDAQEARDAAYLAGKTPILAADLDRAQEMARAAIEQLMRHDVGPVLPAGGEDVETTMVWTEESATGGKVWCRARPDLLEVSENRDRVWIYDIKTTTNAHPEAWVRRVVQLGHAFKAAFYCRGAQRLFELPELQVLEQLDERGLRIRKAISQVTFRFITQETTPPYALAVYELDDEDLIQGDDDVTAAINWWGGCLARDVWPGLPPKVMKLPLPAYYRQSRAAARASGELSPEAMALQIAWATPGDEP